VNSCRYVGVKPDSVPGGFWPEGSGPPWLPVVLAGAFGTMTDGLVALACLPPALPGRTGPLAIAWAITVGGIGLSPARATAAAPSCAMAVVALLPVTSDFPP
jgi:hypothetical protein